MKTFSNKLWIFILALIWGSGCATPITQVEKNAQLLGTYGNSKSIYHVVADVEKNELDHKIKLEHDGFLVAIEKAPNEKICAPKVLDKNRFDKQKVDPENSARLDRLEKITSNPKTMFISHIAEYGKESSSDGSFKTDFLYNIYTSSIEKCAPRDSKSPYEQGWRALDKLEKKLEERLLKAVAQNDPYTHLVVIAMGWSNNQVESIFRYNKILDNLKLAADLHGEKIKPLVIAFSWPSVWGDNEIFGLKQILHIFSYGNKTNDADEVGYTYGNYIVNKITPRLKNKVRVNGKPVKVVVIGHSFGARLLTRSVFSSHILNGGSFPPSGIDYVFGLQGAFSVNRFIEGAKLPFPISLFSLGEGYPYSEYKGLDSKLIMTWSKKDIFNPISALLNGSAHIGGAVGFHRSRRSSKGEFMHLEWTPNQAWKSMKYDEKEYQPAKCEDFRGDKKVFMADLTETVWDHNDICDFQMGYFLWKAMECFSVDKGNVSNDKKYITKKNLSKLLSLLEKKENCNVPDPEK